MPPITAAASDLAGTFHTGATGPARMAAISARRMMTKATTEVTAIGMPDRSAVACAGADQKAHDATSMPSAANRLAPHSANAEVAPHGRPPIVSVAMFTA